MNGIKYAFIILCINHYKMISKYNSKAKSEISFKEFQHIANEVFEFGNEWGFYVDIETNNKLIDLRFIKKQNINTEQHIQDIQRSKFYFKNDITRYSKNGEDYYNNNDKRSRGIENLKIIDNISSPQKTYKYIFNFIKCYIKTYSLPIIGTFMLSYYLFKLR
jgi:hypothetical protein